MKRKKEQASGLRNKKNISYYRNFENKSNDDDRDDHKIRLIVKYVKDSIYPSFEGVEFSKENVRKLDNAEDGINDIWSKLKESEDIDAIEFVNTVLTIVAPSDSYIDSETMEDDEEMNNHIKKSIDETLEEIPTEILSSQLGKLVKNLTEKAVFTEAIKNMTLAAQDNNIKKDVKEYFKPTTQIHEEVDHSKPKTSPKEDPWSKKYWWVILIICIGCVLLIGIIGAVIYVSLSNDSNSSGAMTKKDLKKSNKIMETVIPIEKIKQENGISDDNIYKPFTYEVIMEGYLLKEGHDRVIGKFQRRYCVLYFDPAVLRIYESMIATYYGKVYIDEKQSIPLECYNGIEYKDGSKEFTLILKVRDSSIKTFEVGDKERKIHLKVEGENAVETCKKWVECFRDFKNQKPKSSDAWTKPLIIDESNGKLGLSTSKAYEKRNEEILMKAQRKRRNIENN